MKKIKKVINGYIRSDGRFVSDEIWEYLKAYINPYLRSELLKDGFTDGGARNIYFAMCLGKTKIY